MMVLLQSGSIEVQENESLTALIKNFSRHEEDEVFPPSSCYFPH